MAEKYNGGEYGDMDNYMPMSTTGRHNEIINTFIGEIFPLRKKEKLLFRQSDCALVYWGQKKEPQFTKLVKIEDIENNEEMNDFLEITINELDYVQPDFMVFKNNPYLCNKRETRTAGQPDLTVEVWSRDNSLAEREFKQNLYATSPITEHWYIEQDSNIVKCWIGTKSLPDQSLKNILKTQDGLEFDLRYLAVSVTVTVEEEK